MAAADRSLVAVWELAAQLGWLSPRVLPAPSAIGGGVLGDARAAARCSHHVWVSTERALIGLPSAAASASPWAC